MKGQGLGLQGDMLGQLLMILHSFPALESGNKLMKQGKSEVLELYPVVVSFCLLFLSLNSVTTMSDCGCSRYFAVTQIPLDTLLEKGKVNSLHRGESPAQFPG